MANFQCVSGESVRPRCWCNAAVSTPASLKLQKRSACISSLQRPCSGRAVHGPAGFRAAHPAKPQLHSPQPSDTCQRLVVPSLLVATLASPLPSIAGEATKADDAALEAAQQYSTVTFGGSFGQWDPVIAVFFYLVVGSLTILTLGVLYLSIRNWQDSTDEKKDRARFSKSSQDRELSEVAVKSRARRSPPKRRDTGGGKGFGS